MKKKIVAKLWHWGKKIGLKLNWRQEEQEERNNWARKQILEMAKLGGRLVL